jgi:hypothetical protein
MTNKKVFKINEVSLFEIFMVFLKIGTFTIGGGYAMLPIIQNEILKRKWISEDELPNIIALSQSAPGILSVNISIFAGHKLRGLKGSIVATIGTSLPSFIIILLIASLFTGYQNNPTIVSIFKGIRPVVISLIIVPMIKLAKKNNKNLLSWLISMGALIAVSFLNISPIYILLVIMVLTFIVMYIKEKSGGKR